MITNLIYITTIDPQDDIQNGFKSQSSKLNLSGSAFSLNFLGMIDQLD